MKFYIQFSVFNERYITELCYSRKPLSELMREYPYAGDFAKALRCFSEHETWGEDLKYLTKEERADVSGYFSMLGKGDSVSQKNYFSSRKNYLEEKKAVSEREAKSRNELCIKLGLLAGLAFVILII